MDRKAIFCFFGLLLFGLVFAEIMGPPENIPTGPQEVTIEVPAEAQAQAARIPTSIPADVINAHAETEFIELSCAMARYHMQRFIDGSVAVKAHFESMVNDVKSVIPTLTLNTAVVDEVASDMTLKLDALCSATPATYPVAIKGIVELALGNDGAQAKLKSLGNELSTQVQAKGDEFTAKGAELQAKASTALGGMSVAEIEAMASTLQAKVAEAQSLQAGGPGVDMSRIGQLQTEIQTLTGQMPSESTRAEAEAFQAEAQTFQADAQAFGEKVQSVFGGIQEKMQAAFASKDYSDLKALVNEKWYALFLKVFNANVVDIGSLKAEFESYGINTAPISSVESWIVLKKEEAKGVFNADATEEEISVWIAELQVESAAKQVEVTGLIEQEVSDKWISGFEALKANADSNLAMARESGLDTSEVESIVSQLEAIKTEAHDLIANENRSAALAKIKEAEALMPGLQAAYAALQARGADAKANAEAAVAQLEASKPSIEALINAADTKGLDTSVIKGIKDELNILESEAQAALSVEDNAEALKVLNEAKAKYEEIKIEYNALAGELNQ